ncbi:MAG: hypothetical protein ACK502_07615 [Alphaproteobacteria bacterium]
MSIKAHVKENNELVVSEDSKEITLPASVTNKFVEIANLWKRNEHVIGKTANEAGQLFGFSHDGIKIRRLQDEIHKEVEIAIGSYNQGKNYTDKISASSREMYSQCLNAVCVAKSISLPKAEPAVSSAGIG